MSENKETKNTAPDNKSGKAVKLSALHITLISVAAAIVVLLASVTALSLSYDKIYGGITVAGYDVGGMSAEEAQLSLEQALADSAPVVTVNADGKRLDINFSDFGQYDFETTAETAYNSGRDTFYTRIFSYLTPFVKRNYPLAFYVDEEKLSTCLYDFQQTFDNLYAENTYEITDSAIILRTGHGGNVIDFEALSEKIREFMGSPDDSVIDLPIVYREFEGVDINSFHDEVCTEPEDAKYVNGDSEIIPHKMGYEFSVEEAAEIIGEALPDTEYSIPVIITYPEITEQKLSGQLFADVIASYSTNYNPNEINRTYNMTLAAQKVNGTVVAPGQTFSYNNTVGKRTVAAGYRDAKIFENGRVVDGLAGGICQVSTTIYNAALYADMEIVERKNHSFAVSYAPRGQDATVVWGSIDFKFRNNTKNPIKLTAAVSGGKVTVQILSIKERNFKVDIQNTVLSTKPFETRYVTDETLEEGVEKVVQSGINGSTVRSVRIVYENGKTVKTETLPSSYYIPQTKEIAVKNAELINGEGELISDEAQPDAVQPDEAQPDEEQPDEAQPDEAQPDEAQPDEVQPDEAQPDESQPDTTQPDEAQPDEAQPDTTQPEAPQSVYEGLPEQIL